MQHIDIDFSVEKDIRAYIKKLTKIDEPLRHENYLRSIHHAEEMDIHVKGRRPLKLLETYRPNESKEAYDYRLGIFEPTTKGDTKKIINVLSKIQNPKNYKIEFPEPPAVIKNDTLETYTMKEYPFFSSILQWIFKTSLKSFLADPNGVIVYKPLDFEKEETEFFDPFGTIYSSARVWDFRIDEYYTILLDEKSLVKHGSEEIYDGNVLHIYTRNEVYRVWQVGEKEKRTYMWELLFSYNFDRTPVFRLKGEYVEDTMPFFYESYISGILPYWNKVVREESDKDASFVGSVYPERVEIELECINKECVGGQVPRVIHKSGGEIKMVACGTCFGAGYMSGRSPLTKTTVRRKSEVDGVDPIFPGVEYIKKDIDSVKALKEEINDNRRLGFAAINMEFLADVPLNESGKKREIDLDPLNTFIALIADNIFNNILENSFDLINRWRYSTILTPEQLEDNLPVVRHSNNFEIQTSNMLTQDVAAAKQSNLDPIIVDKLEANLIAAKFSTDIDTTRFFENVKDLDPLSGKSSEEKLLVLTGKGVTPVDYVTSENIQTFIRQAIMKDPNFYDLPREKRIKIIKEMASSKINEINQSKRNRLEERKEEIITTEADGDQQSD